jgi:hypothetical protein
MLRNCLEIVKNSLKFVLGPSGSLLGPVEASGKHWELLGAEIDSLSPRTAFWTLLRLLLIADGKNDDLEHLLGPEGSPPFLGSGSAPWQPRLIV